MKFAELASKEAIHAFRYKKSRQITQKYYAACEKYIYDNDLILYVKGDLYTVYCLDDPKFHAFSLAKIFYDLGDLTASSFSFGGSYYVTFMFRRIAKIHRLQATIHVDTTIPSPVLGLDMHMFSSTFILIDIYRSLIDPLQVVEWDRLLEREKEIRTNLLNDNETVNLTYNNEDPPLGFDDLIDLISGSSRVLVDPYLLSGHSDIPKSKRIQYISSRKLEDEAVILRDLLKPHYEKVNVSIHNLKVPELEFIRRIVVSVQINDKTYSIADAIDLGMAFLIPYIELGPVKVASMFVTCLILLIDYINISSISDTNDFNDKKKKFLLSKLKLLRESDAEPEALFPKKMEGTWMDPSAISKLGQGIFKNFYAPIEDAKGQDCQNYVDRLIETIQQRLQVAERGNLATEFQPEVHLGL